MTEDTVANRSYAVLLRTHIWDDFVARQFRRLAARSGRGDLYVLVDETSGPVPVTEGNVVSHSQQGVKALGLADAGSGNILWYNGDYPLYAFYSEHPSYDYYVMVEYDVAVHGDLDAMIAHAVRERIDFVGLTKGEHVADWPHAASCLDAYAPEHVKKRLVCFAIYSQAAVKALFSGRLRLSREYEEGKIKRWPFCEAYIPTELSLRGLKIGELTELGSTELYDWAPAFAEEDLPNLGQHTFVHPVLDSARYVQAMMKRNWRTVDVLDPRSDLMRRLRRVPLRTYGVPLASAVRGRVANAACKRLPWRKAAS
jgi:hypothetical protein